MLKAKIFHLQKHHCHGEKSFITEFSCLCVARENNEEEKSTKFRKPWMCHPASPWGATARAAKAVKRALASLHRLHTKHPSSPSPCISPHSQQQGMRMQHQRKKKKETARCRLANDYCVISMLESTPETRKATDTQQLLLHYGTLMPFLSISTRPGCKGSNQLQSSFIC